MTDEPVTLTLCAGCHVATGADVEDSLSRLRPLVEGDLPVSIRTAECLGACQSPVSLALQGPGLATYLFAGVDPGSDASDIANTCRTYLDSPRGWIEDARPCGRLRHCLRARIPAL